MREYTIDYSFVKNNTNEIYTACKLYELDDLLCESFTMIKTERILSEFEQEYMPEISAMRKEIREYCDNGLIINHNIDTLGLYNAYTVLIEIEQPELCDLSPYKDYDIEEEYKEDYMSKNRKKLSKKKYLLSKKK
jgi:hypothetical protein